MRSDFYRFCSVLVFASFILSFTQARAQVMEVGIFGGTSFYMGDLNPNVPFKPLNIAYGAIARYNFDDRWTVAFSAFRGKVSGKSAGSGYMSDRNLSFESSLTDISVYAEFNFFDYFTGSRRHWVSPYLYAGVGVFFFNPKSGSTELQPLGTEGQNVGYEGRKPYSKINFSIPFGLGVKFSVSRRICIAAFWQMHKTFTDYIDDVSTTYYLDGKTISPNDPAGYYSDPSMSHDPGMQRGNSKNKDWYSFAGVTLTYKFNVLGSRRCRDQRD